MATGEALQSMLAAIDSINHGERASAPHAERLELISLAQELRRKVDGLVSALIGEAEKADSARAVAGTPLPTWLAQDRRLPLREAQATVFEAVDIGSHEAVRTATISGSIELAQGRAITRVLSELPERLTSAQRAKAESFLIHKAATTPAHRISRLRTAALLEVLSPAELAQENEETRLADQRKRALSRRHLTFKDDTDGSMTFHGSLPYLEAASFVKMIDAYVESNRSSRNQSGAEAPTSAGERRADALTALVSAHSRGVGIRPVPNPPSVPGAAITSRPSEDYDASGIIGAEGEPAVQGAGESESSFRVPTVAGDRPRVVVTMRESDLRTLAEQAGVLEDGSEISAGDLRRLTCDAELIPAVLGTGSQVLDLGRAHRLVSPAQRRALALRDGGCVFPGCETAPWLCEAHHVVPWWQGGKTDLNNLALLCPHHHGEVEPPQFFVKTPSDRWTISIGADGLPAVHPPERLARHPVIGGSSATRAACFDQLSAHAGQLGAHAGQLGAHAGQLGAHAGQLGAHAGQRGASSARPPDSVNMTKPPDEALRVKHHPPPRNEEKQPLGADVEAGDDRPPAGSDPPSPGAGDIPPGDWWSEQEDAETLPWWGIAG